MALQKDTSINFFFCAHAKLQGDIKIHIYSKVACSSNGFLHPLIHLSFESCLCYKRSAEKSRLEDRWFLLFLNKLQFFLFQGIEIKAKFLYEEENPTKMSCHKSFNLKLISKGRTVLNQEIVPGCLFPRGQTNKVEPRSNSAFNHTG